MSSKELLQQRKLIGTNLKNYIRDKGYTTISFAKKADIPYETLKQVLNGELLSDETEFVDMIKKVTNTLDISPETLLAIPYESMLKALKEQIDILSEAIEVKEEMNRLVERQEDIINRLMNISSIQLDFLKICISVQKGALKKVL